MHTLWTAEILCEGVGENGCWWLVAGGWGALWARSGPGPGSGSGAPDGGIEIEIGIGIGIWAVLAGIPEG